MRLSVLLFLALQVQAGNTLEECISATQEANQYFESSGYKKYILNIDLIAVVGRSPDSMDLYHLTPLRLIDKNTLEITNHNRLADVKIDRIIITAIVYIRDKRFRPHLVEILDEKHNLEEEGQSTHCILNSGNIDICCVHDS